MLFSAISGYYKKLEAVSSRLAMIDIMSEMFSDAGNGEIREIVYMTQGVLGPPFEGIETGIAEKFAEAAISAATGFERKEVDDLFRKSGDMGSAAEEMVGKTRLRRMEKKSLSAMEVFQAMLKIAGTSGEGSQGQKIKLLAGLMAASTPLEARYITRLSLGTLRLGAGDATILEALSKSATGGREFKPELEGAYNICCDLGKVAHVLAEKGKEGILHFKVEAFSPIKPALAERLPTAKEILEKMHGRCAVESKYDGMRVQVHMDKGRKKVEIFSRNIERVTEMFPDIANAAMKEIKAEKAIFEGETLAYDEVGGEFYPFQETIQRKRKHGVEEKSKQLPLKLFAFDLLFIDGTSMIGEPYEERRKKLESVIAAGNVITAADRIIAETPKDIDGYFDDVIGKGLEGIVAKDLQSPYIAGARKFSWIKMKRSYKGELSDTIDAVILGYYIGRGSRAEFRFGGLLAGTYNEEKDLFETLTKIGTGFTEEHMEMFRAMLEKIKRNTKHPRVESIIEPDFWVEPKYVVTIRADEITRSQMHTCGRDDGKAGYALRFPRIVSDGVRSDKGPEEATTTKEIIEMFKQQRKTKVE